MIQLWTIGREREKAHYTQFVRDADQQALLFPVIDAIHDLKEGAGSASRLMDVSRAAMAGGNVRVWGTTSDWLNRVVTQIPEVGQLWVEFASNADWRLRWRVACHLYFGIPEDISNRIFAVLRHDRSAKVREYAISRYEERPNEKREVVKMFDAEAFDDRVRGREISI
jgi:hypothetical protein